MNWGIERLSQRMGSTRTLQIGFLFLLLTCVVQVTWWILDQVRYSYNVRVRIEALHDRDAAAAGFLFEHGSSLDEVRAAFPHLVLSLSDAGLEVDRGYREALRRERHSRINQYGWEGGFFLIVLVCGMAVILATLKQRRELLKRQQNFIAAVSHEFKNPLASLKLSAETLDLRELDADQRRTVAQRMVQNVDRLEGLVSNLLAVARLDEGHVQMARELVHVDRIVRELVDDDPFHAREHGVEVRSEVPAGAVVFADPRAVQAVISNLTDNAIKSCAAAGGGRVTVRARAHDGRLQLDIEDDGLGFDPGQSGRMFEKFYRAGEELRRRTRGAGLGLYIVRKFMELEDGWIKASSAGPGKGACFSVSWSQSGPPAEERA